MVEVYISLGSNLGDRQGLIHSAVDALRVLPDTEGWKISPLYETAPMEKTDQPYFLNAVLELRTGLSVRDLWRHMQRIEGELGRVRRERWGLRTIDLDLILYGNRVIEEKDLVVPHPRYRQRAFVLLPLLEIAPELTDPESGKKIREFLEERCEGQEVTLYLPKKGDD
ncbi:MAG: 2-amino-4-hydroxy-6-hydroxymethyldihydropteridine diphosphokinase [Candidatus Latescibacteria bacterium]|nr:2-amino-4-hydroxy-6-hydroxymethyldihydropteridine diphosphokinase [Candidatus Latescibacterota bacterium]